MPRSPDPELRRWWRQLLDSFDPQRCSVAQFCQRNHVSVASFYRWQKQLARPEKTGSLIPVELTDATSRQRDCAALIRIDESTRIEISSSHAYLATDIAIALAKARREATTGQREVTS